MTELATLGRISLRSDGHDLLAGRRKVLALLTFLVRHREPVPRDRLAAIFWPGSSDGRARHSLRQAVSELRNTLGETIEVGATHIGISPGTIALDADAFVAEVEAERCDAALTHWRGEFLPGLEELDGSGWRIWLDGERARLASHRARALAATRTESGATHTTVPPSVQAAPRWAGRELATFSPTREVTGGLLGTLSTEARAVIEAASVLGRRAPAVALARVAGLSHHGFASAVDELESRGMLHQSGGDRGALEFSSEDARQRVYRLVASDRRRHLHAAAARALASGSGLDQDTAEHARLAEPPVEQSRLGLGLVAILLAVAILVGAWYLVLRVP